MDSLRAHTFYLDIRGIRNIKYPLVYDFIADQLELTASDVTAIQFDLTEGKVYVELRSQEKMREVVRDYDGKFNLICDNKAHNIRLMVEDGGTDIKLHHLPPRMPAEWIIKHMSHFGNVISINEQKCKSSRFPNASSGVKIVRLQIQRTIPSYISIPGYSTYVTYNNQVHTCRHCGNIMHRGRSCAENRAVLATDQSKQISYAEVTSGFVDSNKTTSSVVAAAPGDKGESSVLSEISLLSDTSMETLPTASSTLFNKRPATNTDNLEYGKKGKSSKIVHEHRSVSSDHKEKKSTSIISSKVMGSHVNVEGKIVGENEISDDDQQPTGYHRGRTMQTRSAASSREASRNKHTQQ